MTGANYASLCFDWQVRDWSEGLNWHLNRNIKAGVNYAHTNFTGGSEAWGEVTAQD